MKARLGILAVIAALCICPMAKADVPGALQHGFGFTMTFTNVDQIYTLPSVVIPGDVDILNTDSSVYEVLRFIPEVSTPGSSDTAIVYTSDQLPSPPLSNVVSINADFSSGLTQYTACHCDVYYIPTGIQTIVTVVPLPASAAMGGLGVFAVILAGWLRSRRLAA
jgi:hypothetical protein